MGAEPVKIDVDNPRRPQVADAVRAIPPSGIRAFFELVIGRDGTLHDAAITHIEATKESALEFLCQRWAIDPAHVLALGDAEADIGMIRMAGTGVAMGNAHPEVRAAADWIAPSAGDAGVAVALRQFILGAQ